VDCWTCYRDQGIITTQDVPQSAMLDTNAQEQCFHVLYFNVQLDLSVKDDSTEVVVVKCYLLEINNTAMYNFSLFPQVQSAGVDH